MKKCCVCKTIKQTKEFATNKNKKDGLQAQCRICQANYRKKHYEVNRLKYLSKAKKWTTVYKNWYRSLKNNKICLDCKKCWPWYVLHFDHVTGTKISDVSKLVMGGKGKKIVLEEITKCELICANCHAIRTFQRRNKQVSLT